MSSRRHIFSVGAGLALAAVAWTGLGAQQGGNYGYRLGDPNRLSGTYQLDRARSDDPQQVINRATRALPPDQRDRVSNNLLARLDSPDTISLDLNGRAVTIMSSDGPRVSFDADGRDRTEPGPNGRLTTTHADLYGDELTVSTTGNRGSDFTVRFEPVQGGLRVTRQFDNDVLTAPVVVQSVYRRLADQPRWNVYNGGGSGGGYGRGGGRGPIVPDGTMLTARLDNAIDTKTAREGQRFTATVRDPGPYRGAIINGVVLKMNQRTGHADVAFDFDGIRLPDGRSGGFEADIQSVRTPDGSVIRVDRSGNVRERPGSANVGDVGIGAALGAVIGAIAGGGKGAAIGAVVGGGGTLVVEGRDSLYLPPGTELTMSAVTPNAGLQASSAVRR